MVAYSFQRRVAEPILAGTKRQTLRGSRKRHARIGEEVQLYTGMRTKHCRLIARATCNRVEPVHLDFLRPRILVGNLGLEFPDQLDFFARFDGFQNFEEMQAFWHDVHSVALWEGILIGWAPIARTQTAEVRGSNNG